MVKLNRRLKLLISLIAFVAVGWICFQPLSKIGVNKSYLETPKALHKLSQDELIDFLMLWDQMQKGELKGYLEQIPLKNEEGYPRPIVKWLELNNWSVERFFYDEQRIRDILSCVNLERNLNTNVEVSKKTGINLT